jgi:hypothetical protein
VYKRQVFGIRENLFDPKYPNTLGLNYPSSHETFTIFSPSENDNKYNHGVVLYPFKGKLYAQWQSSKKDEDSKDTNVLYSVSLDGETWRYPRVLATGSEKGISTSGGWWSNCDSLIAFINVWESQIDTIRGGYTVYKTSSDGNNWSLPKRLNDSDGNYINGIIEQDLHLLPNGRIVTAFHLQPGLIVSPYFTDDQSAIKGWTKGKMKNLPYKKFISRELEPSLFYRHDNSIVMIFRDQAGSFKQLASVSYSGGLNWTSPSLSEMPDSRSKQSAGNLPSGSVFMINNPSGNKVRYPLVITLSRDGYLFDRAFLIRAGGSDLQPMKYKGKYKREGYSYPKSVIWEDFLYVGYSTNKEEIQLTRIPLAAID